MRPPAPPREEKSILLLALSVCGPGGIQRYLRGLSEALAASPRVSLTVMALDDAQAEVDAAPWCEGVRRLGFDARRRGRVARRAALSLAAIRTALSSRWDAVVAGHVNLAPLALGVARLARACMWLPLHGVEAWDPPRVMRRVAARGADLVLPVSRETARRAASWMGARRPETAVLLPNTVDGSAFPLAPPRPPGAAPVLLTVARLDRGDRQKGVEATLLALPGVRAVVPGVTYEVVGDGDDRGRLEGLARELGIADAVRFRGRLPDALLASAYAGCDVFVLPSRKEGFGIVFLEALATGRPVIGGDSDGAREPLQDGRAGILVDAGSSDRIAAAIVRVLKREVDPALLDGPALRRSTLERFGKDAFGRRVAALLASVPPRGRRP